MNFKESVNYLYSLGFETLVMKFGLENISRILESMGHPERSFHKVQIVGTNGKSSTSAFLNSICCVSKIKTGLYTSPHLISVTERIKIDGKEISTEDFARHASIVRETIEKLVREKDISGLPTFFEHVTAIALSAFAEAGIELAILETGLGGRLDSVTATDAEIIGITNIDYDHQEYLGNSLKEIAAEKAGVIRFDTQEVIVSDQSDEVETVILNRCRKFGIEPRHVSPEFPISELGLAGKHQIENARLAAGLADLLKARFAITTADITEGLKTPMLEGRLEFFDNILFDGAHNRSGAKVLREYLDEFAKKPITMIFGAMKEKDVSEIGRILFPRAAKLVLTRPGNPRSMDIAELAKSVPAEFSKDNLFVAENVSDALKIARSVSGDEGLILVTGSLYLVGEARKILRDQSEI